TEIGTRLQSAVWQFRAGTIARICGDLAHIGRNIHHQPMPESAAGRSVRVKAGNSKALGAARHSRPGKMRRLVAAGAAKAIVGGENMIRGEIIAILETVASYAERHQCGSCRFLRKNSPIPRRVQRRRWGGKRRHDWIKAWVSLRAVALADSASDNFAHAASRPQRCRSHPPGGMLAA